MRCPRSSPMLRRPPQSARLSLRTERRPAIGRSQSQQPCCPTRIPFYTIFRVSYSQTFSHRGFFHSPFLGVCISFLLMILFFRAEKIFSGRWFCYFSILLVIWVSHGVLDALTNGGRGVAFFSPFSSKRYFFPWTPILVSPMSIRSFFSSRGWSVLKSEFVWIWLPGLVLVFLCKIIRPWILRRKSLQ